MVKVIWQKRRIAAAYGRHNHISQVAPMCTLFNNVSLDPPESTLQTASQSVQMFLYSARQRVPRLYNWQPVPPQNCLFASEDLNPHLIYGSFGPPESTAQTAPRLVQPSLQGSRFDRQTDRQTYHATWCVMIGCVYICSTAMQPNNTASINSDFFVQKRNQYEASKSSFHRMLFLLTTYCHFMAIIQDNLR